MKIVNQPS